ncbi:Coenzyme F420 hydrogenase/dehydrogenase, beta subunit C-terminal domain [Dubosiella newyorkensis]|uniref:Coenzyme F420 hydrogenase/dehydrogenase, beta subunit C-terminal domain n=1 Tax=Dubosiella newyorkensis TaxID=1862672 RepID=UPI00248D182B|nr:Coenzyme F420 hydrogenase/dehydrogenase, beta subunit C-terminal domain [Dubosiella newyorkensis]
MEGYLLDKKKEKCYGCEACVQICPKDALSMKEDVEGFRYPYLDKSKCIGCNLCYKICPYNNMPERYYSDKYVFGGYIKDELIKFESTSGGAFSAIVDTFCDNNYVIFGAESKGLLVSHSYITEKKEIAKFRKSKYSQSKIGNSYQKVKEFLIEEKKVLFSGTPCQVAGLKAYLGNTDQTHLLTIEVICEGIPSPLYFRKYEEYLKKNFDAVIDKIDFRYKGHSLLRNHKWDFQIMKIIYKTKGNEKKVIKIDRWFNPFWSVWLKHLMSRPSCYECPFATTKRVADISLGDLWGVHLYCPELYGKNGGASLAVANTSKGKNILQASETKMYGCELQFEEALKYQSPMRKHIDTNPDRKRFMQDLKSSMTFEELNKKWAEKPSLKLLLQKYIWGNRQKVWLWNLMYRNKSRRINKDA